jgi:rifampicin phosphotransferase
MMVALKFDKPSPGSWELDRDHIQRPLCGYVSEVLVEPWNKSWREGMAYYGALLEYLELSILHGFTYVCPRPVGAPAEPKGSPPRFIFKLITWLHPEIRRQIRRAREVMERELWRDDLRYFYDDVLPAAHARYAALEAEDPDAMDDAALVDHLARVRDAAAHSLWVHHRFTPLAALLVGDFLAHVQAWTGVPPAEAIAVLTRSRSSRCAAAELEAVMTALSADAAARRLLDGDADPARILDALASGDGELGRAVTAWRGRVAWRLLSGIDVTERTVGERPDVMLNVLRGCVRAVAATHVPAEDAATALRARVPAEHHDGFDRLLEAARAGYEVRDARTIGNNDWAVGLARRALLAVGRRLVAQGALHVPDHAFDLTHAELAALLAGRPGPSAAEARERSERRASLTVDDAPATLGPPPALPPPDDWLPPHAARMSRAIGLFIEAMQKVPDAPATGSELRGLPAARGKREGVARVVRGPEDFGRLRQGDILVTRITTPAFNVVLPMLTGIVTDRGGVLSHPAIVAREYGIPAVVGTREATAAIADGARVEVDGDAGVVRVLS